MGLGAEAAADMQDYAKHLLDVADEVEGISDSLTKDADAAADLAVEITRMNKGVEALADNFEDWNDILKKSSKDSMEYSEAMSGMKKAVADVLDVESDMISSEFINKHSEDIEKAADGDAEAIDRLRASMDEEIIAKIKLNRPDLTNLDTLDAEIKSKLDEVLQEMKVPDIEVGAVLKDEEFLKAANNLVETSGMSADEANAYFAGIGYEPLYNQEEIPDANVMSAPNVRTVTTVEGIDWAEENMTIGDTELPIKMP
jgi:tyrosyl-tRNA synthetase